MKELTLFEGRPILLNNGRIIRFSKEKLEFEELIDNEWKDSKNDFSLEKAFLEASNSSNIIKD